MSILIAALALALIALVVFVISAPFRGRDGRAHTRATQPGASGDAAGEEAILARDELESAREAKYREIRDAELDYRTGKLSSEDYEAVDRELRAEAIAILNRLDEAPAPGREAETRPADRGTPSLDDDRSGRGERETTDDGGAAGASGRAGE